MDVIIAPGWDDTASRVKDLKSVTAQSSRSASTGHMLAPVIRSFIGERAFHTAVWGIGRPHVEVARRLLLQFDLVLDLDAGDAATNLLMYQGLGWNVTLAEIHARTAEVVSSKTNYSRTECAIEKLLAEVLPRQGPDRELYR
ncbi:hypothetical protein Vafri_5019 [Volvox africanus]|uniref:Uncharacterized protein n=1 Tax=Volvox africanus TaxID=51714 RepID=A0A8J4AWL2_9CHLO|nr:hypothetical protein Vafri_5019 [Volvox africanus]